MRGVFLCFGGQKKFKNFFLNFLATTKKGYIKWLLYFFFFFLKFEKVEKTEIISTKFSLRCTPSVILGWDLQKLGLILESKVGQKLRSEKNVFNKTRSPKLIFLDDFFF